MVKLDMRILSALVLITPVIMTNLKYPDAVGEARMLQPPHDGASPRVEAPRPGPEEGGGPVDA